ncbi:hypothetical protein [Streptomyces sp. NPDC059215]|uniref:hypothetical protein n=1 Tax=Streptomyces sp. NPDC059215 TaxID=3346772 RepID=UPI0036A43050
MTVESSQTAQAAAQATHPPTRRIALHRKYVVAFIAAAVTAGALSACDAEAHSGATEVTNGPAASFDVGRSLEALLPSGHVTERQRVGSAHDKYTHTARLLFESGDNRARLTVMLAKYPAPVPDQFISCPDSAFHPFSQCSRMSTAAGSTRILDESPQDEKNPSHLRVLTASLTYKDGGQVFISESENGLTGKGSPATAPLTINQLSELASSARWKRELDAMPTPPPSPEESSVSRLTGPQIGRLIEKLLPASRMRTSNEGGSEGFGHVVIDDGKGQSLIAVNVQRWNKNASEMKQLFKKATRLADGTLVIVQQGAAPEGGTHAVQWSVDTLRKDGLRVIVSVVNAPAYHMAADRPTPALTIQQIRHIALDKSWWQAARR